MNEITIAFGRALKVWWSFVWRSVVLAVPFSILLMIIVGYTMIPLMMRSPGRLSPQEMLALMQRMTVFWVVSLVAMVMIQTFAMKWMLKTRWSDFRLAPQPNDEGGGAANV